MADLTNEQCKALSAVARGFKNKEELRLLEALEEVTEEKLGDAIARARESFFIYDLATKPDDWTIKDVVADIHKNRAKYPLFDVRIYQQVQRYSKFLKTIQRQLAWLK